MSSSNTGLPVRKRLDKPMKRALYLSNASLLESGEFSDITVTCGEQSWKLHKSILCPRSAFFRVAVKGNFWEGVTSTVKMEAAKLYLVKQVINYLYTGECQWKEFEKEQIVAQTEGVLLSCIKLAEYAHYLGLSDMEEYIGEHLRNHLSYTADEVQKSDVFGNGRAVPLSDKFLRNYITAAEEAFSSLDTVPLPNCREAFIKFVADTRYLVMLDGGFSETIKEVPELHEAIVQSMFDEGSPFLDMVSFNRPSECDVCEEALTVYATSSLVLPKVRGTCFRCAEKP